MPRDLRLLEQAKGVVMMRYGLGSYEALALIARWSNEAGVRVDDTAQALVLGVVQGRVGPRDDLSGLVRWVEQRLRENPHDPFEAPAPPTPLDTRRERRTVRAVRDTDAAAPKAAAGTPRVTHSHRRHSSLRELAGGLADRQWRYSSAVEAARRLGSGGSRSAASSG